MANACSLSGPRLGCQMQHLVTQHLASVSALILMPSCRRQPLQVWDCRRLEKDVSFRSRLTYTAQVKRLGSRLACLTHAPLPSAGSSHPRHFAQCYTMHGWPVITPAEAAAPAALCSRGASLAWPPARIARASRRAAPAAASMCGGWSMRGGRVQRQSATQASSARARWGGAGGGQSSCRPVGA